MVEIPDIIIKSFFQWINNEKKSAFISALVSGIIVHSVIMINQPVCADPVLFMDHYKASNWFLINQGRWATNILTSMRGYIVDPILSTMITVFSMAILSLFVVDLFRIKKTYNAIIIGASMVIHPYIANSLMYYSTSGTVLNFLPGLALWIFYRWEAKPIWKYLITVILYTLVLGVSQGFICTITLFSLIILIVDLLEKRDKAITKFLKNIVLCGISCVIYEIIWIALMKISNISTLYGGAENYGVLNTLKQLPRSLKTVYLTMYAYFGGNTWIHNTYWHREILYLILIVVTGLEVILTIHSKYRKKEVDGKTIWAIIASILLIPPFALSVLFITTEYKFYLMMANSFVLILPLFCKLLEQNSRVESRLSNVLNLSGLLSILIIMWTYVLSDIAGYRLLNHTYIQTKELAGRLLTRIEENEEFSYDMPVCFIGQPSSNVFQLDAKLFASSPGGTFSQQGVFPEIWENSDGWGLYIYRYSGVKLNYYSNGKQSEIRRLAETNEFEEMKEYPSKESIKCIDGVMVVKLGEYDASLPD